MRRQANPARRRRALAAQATATLAVLVPSGAARSVPVESFSVDVTARAGVSSNPFLLPGDDTAGADLEIGVDPRYRIEDERGVSLLQGYFRGTQYLSKYGNSYAFGAQASSNRRFSDEITARAELGFDNSVLQEQVFFGGGPLIDPGDGLGDGEVIIPIDPEIGFGGGRQRRVSFDGLVGLTYQPNARDTLDFSADVNRTRYPGRDPRSNFRSFGGQASYLRSPNQLTAYGVRASVERIEYDGGGSEAFIYQPQLILNHKLDETWSIAAAVGGLFIDQETEFGSANSTGLSADIRACKTELRLVYCLGAAQGASATGFGGVRKQTSLDTSLSYKLSELETVSGRAAYVRSRGELAETGERADADFVTIGGSYDRRISERLSAGLSLGYRSRSDDFDRSASDVSGQVFVRMTFGRVR